MDEQMSASEAARVAHSLMALKMFSLASFVMLVYDIVITFGDEVEKIWNQPFRGATVLWFINRYLPPLGYMVIIVGQHDPDWTKEICDRYLPFPEVFKTITLSAIGAIFILRLYSIYCGNMLVVGPIVALFFAQLAIKIWAFTDGTRVVLPEGLVGCVLTGRNVSSRFIYTWVVELIFDTAVFVATLTRTLTIYRQSRTGAALPLVRVMMRDGIIYFTVIFCANLTTVVLFLILPQDLQAINAMFSTLLTTLMVSRLILNLRRAALRPRYDILSGIYVSQPVRTGTVGSIGPKFAKGFESTFTPYSQFTTFSKRGRETFASAMIGNLGEQIVYEENEGADNCDESEPYRDQRQQPQQQSLVGRDIGNNIHDLPLRIDADGIVLREFGVDRQKSGAKMSHSDREQTRSHLRPNKRARTRGGASISMVPTSPPRASGRLQGVIVEVTHDVRVESSLGNVEGDGCPAEATDDSVDRLPENDATGRFGDLQQRQPESSMSLRSDNAMLDLHTTPPSRSTELAREDDSRIDERGLTPSRLRKGTNVRSSSRTHEPAWVPPDTWNLEEGVELNELGKAI